MSSADDASSANEKLARGTKSSIPKGKWDFVKDTYASVRTSVEKYAKEVQLYLKKNPDVVRNTGWVMAGLAASAAMFYIYKKYFSQAARACAGKKDDAFKSCVARAKAAGERKAITAGRTAMSKCKDTSCRQKYMKAIKSHEVKLKKYS